MWARAIITHSKSWASSRCITPSLRYFFLRAVLGFGEECKPKGTRQLTHQEPVGKSYEERVTVTGADVHGPMCQKFQDYQPQVCTATDYDVLTYAAEKKSSLGWKMAIGVGIGLLIVGAILITGGLAAGPAAAAGTGTAAAGTGTFLTLSGGATGSAVASGSAVMALGGGAITIGQLGNPTGEDFHDYTQGSLISTVPQTDYSPWVNSGAIYKVPLGPPYPCP
jgi:hypothetical protein